MAISKQLHIEAIQTAIPSNVTQSGKSRRINLTNTTLTQDSLQSRFRMVFYYNKSSEEESAWTVAAWVKESMSVALADWPELAGRLRKDREGDGCWEIKINDAGVRLVQASVEMQLDEFLAAEDRAEKEAALANWSEIDGENPDFSALFYIQVTQFEGNGYAVGITFSLLLNDPLFLIQFLKSWTQTHMGMLADGSLSKNPMFHLGYFQRPSRPKHLKSIALDSFPCADATTTILFKAPEIQSDNRDSYRKLASTCIEEAVKSTRGNGMSKFSLIVNKSDGLEIESCDIGAHVKAESNEDVSGAVKPVKWQELGMEDFTLTKGNKPVYVSYRFMSLVDEPLIVMMQSDDQEKDGAEMFIGAAIPN
ncbi:HXXXD-type acyl-transferase family protein [Rhynchospora pubera]|uniref:HXXXD-type acyl-transferase family protein n=1 Tax=Rhynchospora pubera TaxID=906938 RepID=A0AAV8G8V6_9POAL|nr:HXXXD-type acyl-transferase family protein [Rhynchospora pubera]